MQNLVGHKLGQYEILELIGEGGMGTVYRARQPSVKREVAIKVIDTKLAKKGDFLTHFKREAQTIASLSHPHILKIFDYGVEHGFMLRLIDGTTDPLSDIAYLAMELLTGGSLYELLFKQTLPLSRVLVIMQQMSAALDHAHKQGVIHRDLKPQNILMDETGNTFLTDFGIAKIISDSFTLTQTGMAIGTPSYMAPEQWQGKTDLDGRSDQYSLGVILFEMLTDRLPFRADTPYLMMYKALNDLAPLVSQFRQELPPEVDQVVAKALAKDPQQRYNTASELTEAFKAAIGNVLGSAGTITTGASKSGGVSAPMQTGAATATMVSPIKHLESQLQIAQKNTLWVGVAIGFVLGIIFSVTVYMLFSLS